MIYVKIETEKKGLQLSKLMMKLITPVSEWGKAYFEKMMLVNLETNKNGSFLVVPENYPINIVLKPETKEIMDEIAALLGPDVFAEGENSQLAEKVRTGTVVLSDIIPSQMVRVDESLVFKNLKKAEP